MSASAKVLVTGSSGFIGRAVVERLRAEGKEVVGLDRAPPPAELAGMRHHDCDIRDKVALERVMLAERPDAVLHLAARTDLAETSDLRGYDSNIEGVRNVCTAVRAAGTVRIAVYTSSQLVCRIGYVPRNDTDYCPSTLYGESKVLTEKIVREENGGDAAWCIVRPTSIWGPHMNEHYRSFLRHLTAGRYFHVGRAPLHKSYGYVGNVAYQYARLLEAPRDATNGRTFFVADYEPISLRAYADALSVALTGRAARSIPRLAAHALAGAGDVLNAVGMTRFPFNHFRLRNMLTEYVVDLEPTRAVCGPSLPYSFDDGIKATAAWYRSVAE